MLVLIRERQDVCCSYFISIQFIKPAHFFVVSQQNADNIIQKILKNLNVNPKTFALRATSSSIKESLKKRTSEAYEKGVFGAPTFVSNNKIFWGQDRIEFVLKEASK